MPVPRFKEQPTPTTPTRRRLGLGHRVGGVVESLTIPEQASAIELGSRRERILIGASSSCDLVVGEDKFVSAEHCLLEPRDSGHWFVKDLNSKNGTFVNGYRIEVAELAVGSWISIGRTQMVAKGCRPSSNRAVDQLIGSSDLLRQALVRATRAARTSLGVLVVGETGTGKELFARAIHEASARSRGPFVAINCGAIPGQLIESELFGHAKGAFTGAESDREGLLARASGGTLFLDELGELPTAQQPTFLRALETGTVRRVGEHQEQAIDVRLVSASNRTELTGESSPLRSDLFHRLATLVIELPALRHRPEDIPDLVHYFLDQAAHEFGPRHIAPEVVAGLRDYSWPGNVRELRHAVFRAAALTTHNLRLADLLPRKRETRATISPCEPMGQSYIAAQKRLLADAYQRHHSIRRAAAALGMPKSTFLDRARRFGVIPSKHREPQDQEP